MFLEGPIQHAASDIPAPPHDCANCGQPMVGFRWADKPCRCQWDCRCGAESFRSLPLPGDHIS